MFEHNDNKPMNFFFCDTTLRDGEQSPGVSFTPQQKVEIAQLLDEIGIESIDAGFAATSAEERLSIRMICELGLKLRVMSMCRVNKEEIDLAAECGVNGVILFIPGSDIHLKAKFQTDLSETRKILMNKSMDAIKYAKDKGLYVEYGLEDATRTDMNFLLEVLHMGNEAGADLLGITDTVGASTPERMYTFVNKLVHEFNKPIGVHCHNDFGLATANTIAGLLAGGGYCSPTVNGIGERAGNASLEEIIMSLQVLYGQDLKYNTKLLGRLSELVEKYSNIQMDPFKPVVGRNAYSHESGIHTHGMLKDPLTYEILNPESVGRTRKYVIGKHSGKHVVKYVLESNGFTVSDSDVSDFWSEMKRKEQIGMHYTESDVIKQFVMYSQNKGIVSNL